MGTFREHLSVKAQPPNSMLQEATESRPSHNFLHAGTNAIHTRVFIDAAFSNGVSAAGVVVRNEEGVVSLLATAIHPCNSAFEAEMKAVSFAANVISRFNFQMVSFYSDAKLVVDALSLAKSPVWTFQPLCIATIDALASCNGSASWIPRTLNQSAHFLAKWALQARFTGFSKFWEVTPHVVTILLSEF